jgi:hypothetical protein
MRRDETLFILKDPEDLYTVERIQSILRMAETQGHPLEKGSYLEKMTIRQIDDMVHGRLDS